MWNPWTGTQVRFCSVRFETALMPHSKQRSSCIVTCFCTVNFFFFPFSCAVSVDLAPTDKGNILAYALVQARVAERSIAARADGGLAQFAVARSAVDQSASGTDLRRKRQEFALRIARTRASSASRISCLDLLSRGGSEASARAGSRSGAANISLNGGGSEASLGAREHGSRDQGATQ